MESEHISKDKCIEIESNETNNKLKNIKSNYTLSKIYSNLLEKKSLQIVKYNKKIQKRLNLSTKDYKEYLDIEIEIITTQNIYDRFINIEQNDKSFYHIYFNDNKEEIKKKYKIKERDEVEKIKIKIDYQIKSFENLFEKC